MSQFRWLWVVVSVLTLSLQTIPVMAKPKSSDGSWSNGHGYGKGGKWADVSEPDPEPTPEPTPEPEPIPEPEPTPEPEPVPETLSLTLSWTIPTAREDGTPLTLAELSGYELVYTSESGVVEQVVQISGASQNQYQVVLDLQDTYHFAVAAIDQNGLRSTLSSPVSYTWSTQ